MLGTTLVLGGVRSGKSAYALREANSVEGRKAFIATAEALDEEMAQRVNRHRSERGPNWDTFEEPLNITPLLDELVGRYSVILIDCMTLWVSNLMHAGKSLDTEFDAFVAMFSRLPGVNNAAAHIYVVSNEVGLGIVPDSPLGREYRDALGTVNRKAAEAVQRVVLMVAGIPIEIKGRR